MTTEERAKKSILQMRSFLGMERYGEGDIDKIALAALDALARNQETIREANIELDHARTFRRDIMESVGSVMRDTLPPNCAYEYDEDREILRKSIAGLAKEALELRRREALLFDAIDALRNAKGFV